MSLLDDRGQSAPLGMALLLGLMLIGTTAVVAFGSTALSDTQEQSDLAKAEQTMTLFDSQTAQVALGDASVQTVDFGQAEGNYEVRPNAGKISIVQLDCDNNGTDDDGDDVGGGADSDPLTTDDDAYILPPTNLGEVGYTKDDQTIAYQGGGVWRKDENGGSTMISPPEFHYRGATLTLPVILTRGQGAGSGSLSAQVADGPSNQVFPNATASYPDRCWQDGDPEPFQNPTTDGRTIVRIESEYADAWGRHFESRTDGEVDYPTDNVVTVELTSLGQIGDFQMPGDAGSVTVSGASDDHSTEDFSITLRPDDTDSADFNNLQWSMYAEEGDYEFEMHLKKSGSGEGCESGTVGNTSVSADLTIYFSDDGGDHYQGWYEAEAFDAECDADDNIYLTADFVDDEDGDSSYVDVEGGDVNLTYTSLSQSQLEYFKPNGDFDDSTTFSGHDDWESETYDASDDDNETVDRLVNHYFAELPSEFELTVDDKNSDTINEAGSSGTLVTGGSDRYVTYLHVTKNDVEVDVD